MKKDIFSIEQLIRVDRKIIMNDLTGTSKEDIVNYLKLYPSSSLDYIDASEYCKIRRVNMDGDKPEKLIRLFEISNIELLKNLIDLGANINIINKHGKNALINCIDSESEKIKFLINKGINVNHRLNNGKNALFIFRDMEIIKLLVEKGIDYNAVDTRGQNFLFSHENKLSNLYSEISKNNPDFSPDWNIKDKEGNSLLHKNIDREEFEFLISKGVNVNNLNNKGETFLWKAFDAIEDIAFMEKIMEAGLDINIKDKKGKNFLEHYVCNNEKNTNLDKTLDCMIDIQKGFGKQGIFSNLVENILEKQNLKNRKSKQEIVKYLVEKGADVSFMSKNISFKLQCSTEIKTYLENVYLNSFLKSTPSPIIKKRI